MNEQIGACNCDLLNNGIANQVLRAARYVLAGKTDMMTMTAMKFVKPLKDFLELINAPTQFVNAISERPYTRLLVGQGLQAGCPMIPTHVQVPMEVDCKLPPGQLVCCCGPTKLGDSTILGDAVRPPLTYDVHELACE
ncbi:hypothetical protein PENSPDRAFT_695496 [Peniophora sp. CONT]|nr:hypothetical protein PENSPDRAFT_695496 [Peniophora sp. CONT]